MEAFFYLTLLSYGFEAVNLGRHRTHQLNVCWNTTQIFSL